MAAVSRSRRQAFVLVAQVLWLAPLARSQPELLPRQINPDALQAYGSFWDSFEEQQQKLLNAGQKKYQKNWEGLERSYRHEAVELDRLTLNKLKETAQAFRRQIQAHPDSASRAAVLLSLAQVLFQASELQRRSDPAAGAAEREEALGLISELRTAHRGFAQLEQAIYLAALIHAVQGEEAKAFGTWQQLAAQLRESLYGVFAHTALGDHHFQRENPYEAMDHYRKARRHLKQAKLKAPDDYQLVLAYRFAWAAYRAGALAEVLEACTELLTLGRPIAQAEAWQAMQLDAVQLMGDALFEHRSPADARRTLADRRLGVKAVAIGLHLMQRYGATRQHEEAIVLGEAMLRAHPLAPDLPRLLTHLASSYKVKGQLSAYAAALGKLSLLLPANSLWRTRHREDPQLVQQMEELAVKGASLAAVWNYDKGMNSGSAQYFLTAAALYKSLMAFGPDPVEVSQWRVRLAHCYYFAESYAEASLHYEDLLENYKLSDEPLRVVSYQLVLTYEKRWREAYASTLGKGGLPMSDATTGQRLAGLERAIEQYAAKFPEERRTVDLLLVGAGAFRDSEQYDKARSFWQKALLQQASVHQRAMALRGIVFSYVKAGTSGEVIVSVRRFLRLEDWPHLGAEMRQEFLAILGRASRDEAKRLSEHGQVAEAGRLLVKIAEEFADLPQRAGLYRDGAYWLAIAGDWSGAQKAAQRFLALPLRDMRGDMIYLLARAFEYQLNFLQAAEQYWSIGRQYPEHGRAKTSLMRAHRLALAEDEHRLAGDVAALLAQRLSRPAEKLSYYAYAADAYLAGGASAEAVTMASKRLAASKSADDKLASHLLIAKAYLAGNESAKAEARLGYLINQAQQWRGVLGEAAWAHFTAEARFVLGEERVKRYAASELWQQKGALAARISRKTADFRAVHAEFAASAATADPQWAPQSRFRLAELATRWADELAAATQGQNELAPSERGHYRGQVKQLQTLAKRLHGQNVLAHSKDPARYSQSAWVRKSSLRLAGARGNEAYPVESQLPRAVHFDFPYQWSL